jgi:radical SAM protein with 4Fe4S-binding SPASM domain
LRKLSNWGWNKLHFKLRRERVPSYPHFAIIEPGNLCNLKCPQCATGQHLPVPRGFMEMETFKRVIDQLSPYVRYISLYYLGEPLLCAHLPEMIRYAHQHKITTFVSTNLNIFDGEKAEGLIDAKLDYLIVSVDGASQEVYERYRVGGDLEKVLESLRLLIDKKKEMQSGHPRIVLQPVVFKHNEHEIPKLEALAENLGVAFFARQGTLGGAGQSPPVAKDIVLTEQWLSRNPDYHKEYDYLSDAPYLKDEPCYYLWKGVTINWDGSIFPCCWVHDPQHSFGNILDQDLDSIWNNALYRSSRSLFRSRRDAPNEPGDQRPETVCFQCKIFRHRLNERC